MIGQTGLVDILAFQLGRAPESRGFTHWLVDFLIQPDLIRQYPLAARQSAIAGLLTVIWGAVIAAILAFLFKLWRESVARGKGARFIAHGPRRSLATLVLWLFIFIAGYLTMMYGFTTTAARFIGPANIMTLLCFGAVLYTTIFLLLHLPAHPTHMPWRGVK